MEHLSNGILCSRKKEGTPTLDNNMDGTGEYYARWNKSVGKDKSHLYVEANEQNKQMSKTEPGTWK